MGLFLSLLAASQIVVGGPGSGADFNDIQPAINAANPGDTILVGPGVYTQLNVDKPLTIIGSGPDQTVIGSKSIFNESFGAAISAIPAGQRLTISGVRFEADGSIVSGFGEQFPNVRVEDCLGAVQFHDVEFMSGAPAVGPGGPGQVLIVDCELVHLDRVTVSEATEAGIGTTNSGYGIRSTRSTVWITSSEVNGGISSPGSVSRPGLVVLESSNAFVTSSTFTGGPGVVDIIGSGGVEYCVGSGGALADSTSTLRVHGGSGSVFHNSPSPGGLFCAPDPGFSIFDQAAFGGSAQVSLFGDVHLTFPDGLIVDPTVAPALDLAPASTPIGGSTTVMVVAEPSAAVLLAVASPGTEDLFLSGIEGAIGLPLAGISLLATGVASPEGLYDVPLSIPNVPALAGSIYAAQALAIEATAMASNVSYLRIDL